MDVLQQNVKTVRHTEWDCEEDVKRWSKGKLLHHEEKDSREFISGRNI